MTHTNICPAEVSLAEMAHGGRLQLDLYNLPLQVRVKNISKVNVVSEKLCTIHLEVIHLEVIHLP
jgi:hypothetical protein